MVWTGDTYLRQSRYCPYDRLAGFAATELGHLDPGARAGLLDRSWVAGRLTYIPGSNNVLETATDTLLAGIGVCRDFAHLTIALCRALGVPARLAAVSAPGLSPMDFHAVVEARRGQGWEVLDPTGSHRGRRWSGSPRVVTAPTPRSRRRWPAPPS